MRDLSFSNYSLLRNADIIACENQKQAKKLFNLLDIKNIEKDFTTLLYEFKDELSEEDLKTLDNFVEVEKQLEEEKEEDHKNMFLVKREHQRLAEFSRQKEDFDEMVNKSKNILNDLESLSFEKTMRRNKEEADYYDSWRKETKDKTIYGLDDPMI